MYSNLRLLKGDSLGLLCISLSTSVCRPADLARVTGNADPRVIIIAENIIQNGPGPLELGIGGFPFVTLPQLVILGEPHLEFESRK